jgi:hypothetical protein
VADNQRVLVKIYVPFRAGLSGQRGNREYAIQVMKRLYVCAHQVLASMID